MNLTLHDADNDRPMLRPTTHRAQLKLDATAILAIISLIAALVAAAAR